MLFSKQGRKALAAGACLLLLAVAGTSWAFVAPVGHDSYEIALPEFDFIGHQSAEASAASAAVANAAGAAFGGSWHVYTWNPQTATASDLYGSGFQAAPAFGAVLDVVTAGRDVIAANPGVFRADVANLRFDTAPHVGGKWSVHFQQQYQGVDVHGGKVYLTFTDQGRLFVMGSNYYQGIDLNVNPSIPLAVATDIAVRALPFNPGTDSVLEDSRLLVLPVPASVDQVEYHLVWQVTVRTEEPVGKWVTSVDAHTGNIIWRYNDIHFVDYGGTTHGIVERPDYCAGQQNETFPHLRVTVQGLTPVYADANGNWTVPYTGSDARSVSADLYSPYVDLNNVAGAEGTFTGTATPGVPLDVAFTDANSQRDEKDVYRAVNDIHDYYQPFDPNYGYVNARISANVSRNSTCNAYWDGTINFYIQGGGCANTGQIMGVVHHEFCHGISNDLLGGQGTEGIGEGNSDILSNLMTRDPVIGRGFYLNNCTSGIRNSQNNMQYPEDKNGTIHHDGQIIAGFQWDATQLLEAQYGQEEGNLMAATRWHFARRLQRPTSQPAQVLATFVADDDDGDLTNGTPNYDIYCTAARNHDTDDDAFHCPEILVGVFITHSPLSSRTEAGDAEVLARITSTEGALVPDSLRLNYRFNGGEFVSVRLMPTGNPDYYSAMITGLAQGTEVEYYLRARDIEGNTKTHPVGAPEVLHAFDVCTVFDAQESESGWTVNAEGGDNATSGLWVRVDPNGTTYNGNQIQPENDRTADPGVMCWVTGQGSVGGAAGEQDVDGGATTLYSPVYNLAGANLAKVKYHRWYTDDLGVNPGDDDWVVQVSNNGGSWTTLETTSVSASEWQLRSYDLRALFGDALGDVQFKFIASDTNQNSLLEAAVDDFELLVQQSGSSPDAVSAPLRFALLGSRPNPVQAGASVEFSVPATTSIRMAIYDVAGREVRLLANQGFTAGAHAVRWDGADAQGRPVSSGVYYCRMQGGGFDATRPIVVTR